MKHIFLSFLLIPIHIAGMITPEFLSKTDDDLYAIMTDVEQNKFLENGSQFLKKCVSNGNSEIIEQIDHRSSVNNRNFLPYQNYRSFYKKCIARILPYEICKHIDDIYAELKNIKRKETFIKTTRGPGPDYHCQIHLNMSNNGNHFSHNILRDRELIDTEKSDSSKTIKTGYRNPIDFSPNNNYCIIKDSYKTYFYNLIQQTELNLMEKKETLCFGITFSNNSQHILFEGRDKIQQSRAIYFLSTLNENGIPQKFILQNKLFGTQTVLFHPDNNHIIHNRFGDELHLYNITTTEDSIISPLKNGNVFIDTLTLTPDNKTIIAKIVHDPSTLPDHIVFNIENLDKVSAITLPPQSCHAEADLPVLSIPHKKMLTQITNQGCTLQLLDHETQPLISHCAPKDSYITALTVDTTGTYLAVGHSDGTIMIWSLFGTTPANYEKTWIKTTGIVKTLTISANLLLLSQSKSNKSGTQTVGDAILWDLYGNQIIYFGDKVIASMMSSNGKTINIVTATLHEDPFTICNWIYYPITETHYQTDKLLAQYKCDGPSLAHLSRLINEWNKVNHT